jgi:hypothetical protein
MPIIAEVNVFPSIISLSTEYNESTNSTLCTITTVGMFDHIGIKVNDDDNYIRLKDGAVNVKTISGVNPAFDVFQISLFDKYYKILYSFIQAPESFIADIFGENGDLQNQVIEGVVVLDLSAADVTEQQKTDFINAMNEETGGETVIVNIYQGSAIIDYNVIFDNSVLDDELDAKIQKINNPVAVKTILDRTTTLNNASVLSVPSIKKSKVRAKKNVITKVVYDKINDKLVFKTIGFYKSILYKLPSATEFIETITNTIDLPVGFVDTIDAKLIKKSGEDITIVKTFTVDRTKPVIQLNGLSSMLIIKGEIFTDPGATATDNSNENIIVSVSGAVNVNVEGAYTLTYTAKDSSGNVADPVQRTVNVLVEIIYQEIIGDESILPTVESVKNTFTLETGVDVMFLEHANGKCRFILNPVNGKYSMKNFFIGSNPSPLYNNHSITSIILPGCTNLGHDGFADCINLSNIDCINVTSIQNNCFMRCNNIATINLPELRTIGNDNFNNSKIVDLILPKLEAVNLYSFYNNTLCTTIDFRGLDINQTNNKLILPAGDYQTFTNYLDNGTIYLPISFRPDTSLGETPDQYTQRLLNKGWTVTYIDSVAPVITLNGDSTIQVVKGSSYVDSGATVVDNSGESINANVSGTVDTEITGTYVLTYTAADSSGNAASPVQRTVIVVPFIFMSIKDIITMPPNTAPRYETSFISSSNVDKSFTVTDLRVSGNPVLDIYSYDDNFTITHKYTFTQPFDDYGYSCVVGNNYYFVGCKNSPKTVYIYDKTNGALLRQHVYTEGGWRYGDNMSQSNNIPGVTSAILITQRAEGYFWICEESDFANLSGSVGKADLDTIAKISGSADPSIDRFDGQWGYAAISPSGEYIAFGKPYGFELFRLTPGTATRIGIFHGNLGKLHVEKISMTNNSALICYSNWTKFSYVTFNETGIISNVERTLPSKIWGVLLHDNKAFISQHLNNDIFVYDVSDFDTIIDKYSISSEKAGVAKPVNGELAGMSCAIIKNSLNEVKMVTFTKGSSTGTNSIISINV